MKQRCRKIKRVGKKQDGTLGLTEHVRFLLVGWKFLAKSKDERVHKRGTKAHLSRTKGDERVYKWGYKCSPFVRNLRIPPCRICLSCTLS